MRASATTLGLCAGAFLIVWAWHRRSGRRGRWIRAAAIAAIAMASLLGPMAVRGQGGQTTEQPVPDGPGAGQIPSRAGTGGAVTLIALDAGSLELVTNAAARGRLPNFGRLLDAGAVMDLATLRPTSAEGVWTAVATGKLPEKNGIRSPAVYRLPVGGLPLTLLPDFAFASGLVRFGFLTEEAHDAASVRARTLWNILNTHGMSVGVVNWPLTYPAPPVHGFVISDLRVRFALAALGSEDEKLVHPPDLHVRMRAVIEDMRSLPDVMPPVPGAVFTDGDRTPSRIDRIHARLAEGVWSESRPQVLAVRYESLDPIGHNFLRYAMPARFGNVTEQERLRYGAVLESHYGIIDEAIGRTMERLGPDDLLLVVSGYGMEPLSPGKRLVEQLIGDPDVSGTHENAPDGFLMAYGAMVAPNRHLTRASIVDVVPTVLYFLGLPVARDMDGFARTALFRSTFTDERPITYIPSYEAQ
jgi:hypothetical protein